FLLFTRLDIFKFRKLAKLSKVKRDVGYIYSESATAFAKVLAELEVIVMRMVAKSLGIEQDYEKLLESTTYIFKFNKYLSPPGGEKTVGIVPHTDKGFMTIIQQQKDGKGLEIKTKDGEWIEVEFTPSSFIVMAGDVCTVTISNASAKN
ncbi:probable 2-oxoglutarate-dependent dioxygenase AOP1, partial [Tanacetum coccineum]